MRRSSEKNGNERGVFPRTGNPSRKRRSSARAASSANARENAGRPAQARSASSSRTRFGCTARRSSVCRPIIGDRGERNVMIPLTFGVASTQTGSAARVAFHSGGRKLARSRSARTWRISRDESRRVVEDGRASAPVGPEREEERPAGLRGEDDGQDGRRCPGRRPRKSRGGRRRRPGGAREPGRDEDDDEAPRELAEEAVPVVARPEAPEDAPGDGDEGDRPDESVPARKRRAPSATTHPRASRPVVSRNSLSRSGRNAEVTVQASASRADTGPQRPSLMLSGGKSGDLKSALKCGKTGLP
jgi:hypothetical protein